MAVPRLTTDDWKCFNAIAPRIHRASMLRTATDDGLFSMLESKRSENQQGPVLPQVRELSWRGGAKHLRFFLAPSIQKAVFKIQTEDLISHAGAILSSIPDGSPNISDLYLSVPDGPTTLSPLSSANEDSLHVMILRLPSLRHIQVDFCLVRLDRFVAVSATIPKLRTLKVRGTPT